MMLRFVTIFLVIAVSVMARPPAAKSTKARGVETELAVYQLDPSSNKDVLLYCDTTTLVDSMRTTGFLIAFSVELQYVHIDTGQTTFLAQVITLGPPIHTYSRQFTAEYGLPARIDDIRGKAETRYSLKITPLKRAQVDTVTCHYSHLRKDDFSFDPSANFDLHYVRGTYGDYFWNVVKGILEDRYETFSQLNKFNMPGKYSIYLCPCELNSVLWDQRFGTMVDPTRSVVCAIYNRSFNAVDPMIANQIATLRNYGYSPSFLSEGFANYLSLAIYDMKALVREHKMVPLDSLLSTYGYYRTDARLADRISATFVRYLVDQYKIDQFLRLYKQADDLTLRQTLQQVYGKSVGDLEKDWLQYVDTVTIRASQYSVYADIAEASFDYPLMLRLQLEALARATTRADSVYDLNGVVRANFANGNYYEATNYQRRLIAIDTVYNQATDRVALAGYQMMNGYYDSALTSLTDVATADSGNPLIQFNRALNALCQGDTSTARQIYTHLVTATDQPGPYAESRIMLANILMATKKPADRSLAMQYYREAISQLQQTVQAHTHTPQTLMWIGIAYLGEGDTGNANDYLQSALFLETRPFYVGMICLWMGKTADARGERSVAREYYGKVLAQGSADYHQKEARKFLEQPYVQ